MEKRMSVLSAANSLSREMKVNLRTRIEIIWRVYVVEVSRYDRCIERREQSGKIMASI